jgi:hypothetical protein
MQWVGKVSKDAKSHTLTTITPFVQTITIIVRLLQYFIKRAVPTWLGLRLSEEKIMRRIILACALTGILAVPALGQGVDPLLGTWKLNLQRPLFHSPKV